MRGRCGKLLLTTTAWVTLGFQPAWTNPLGGQVVGGGATIQGQGTAKVTVTQTTDKAIINWNTFNIGAGEQTQFIQPSSSAIALNRVTGGLGPSQLYGTLTANGRIFLVNPDGILVGPGARIDTAGFLATTSDIRNEDFLAGRYNFFIPGRPDASVVNLGAITASGHGFAALVAPGVRNSGTITATLGKISLASGNVFALDFYGDSLIKLAVNDAVAAQVKDVASGQTLRSLISNDGKLSANGGRVQLSAATARQIVDSVINTSGVIEANTIGTQNGKIVLMSQTAATKLAGAPAQTVKVSGLLSAAGPNAGETGGTILITGENVVLANARLNASGDAGGGKVLIGGDWGGGAPPTSVLNASARLETNLIPTATNVNVDANTVIDASALQIGDGGKVIVWADGATNFAGTILARGGLLTGNGGFVETSGHALNVDGARVDTSAPNGNTGTWLLDPFNLLIDAAAAVAIANGLSASNLIVQTTVTGTSGPGNASAGDGDITVAADISWNSGNSLTLSAYRNIIVNANVINTGGAAVTLRADNTGTGVGTVSFGAGKSISTAGAVSIFYNPAGNDNNSVNAFSYTVPTDFSANIVGGGTLTAYMLVNTVYDLQNIQNNLSGSYALGRDIDASATASWNAGAGFLPIGSSASRFRGVFDGGSADGQRHFIGGLTINSAARDVGLFGFTESTAIIRKLDLINVSVSSNFDSTLGSGSVGGLVGFNRGSIAEVAVTGNVSASAGTINFFKSVGGLVGQNFGTITASNSFGTVSGNEFASVGGLVGRNPGIITNSSSESAVSSPRGPANVGGLVGNNIGQILDSHASGAVSGTGTFVSATPFTGSVGGLVGWNGQNSGNAAIISNSYASGDVNGYGTSVALVNTTLGVGGLVGFNHTTGRIENSHATGAVTSVNSTATGAQAILQSFLPFTGGLVGWNGGTISDSYANGSINVTGALVNTAIIGGPLNGSPAGGLVGINLDTGQIIRSYATGSIVGTNLVFGGGLVGANDGTISVAYATGNVTLTAGVDQSRVGGFAGRVAGTVDRAYALGNVTADFIGMTGFAGGFAGSNRGLISQSYSMGSVTAGGSQELFVGGFTGLNHNTISKSYSLTPVATVGSAAEKFIGGFAGLNTGTLDQVYATGLVQAPAGSITGGLVVGATTPAGSVAGGLVGSNTMTDFTFNSLPPLTQSQITFRTGVITNSYWDKDSTGQTLSDGGAGLSTAAARQQASYLGFDFSNNWFILDGQTRPFLRSEWSTTIRNAHELQLIAMNLSATYTLANNLSLGAALAPDANNNYPGMWGSSGFVPIGSGAAPFTGALNGQNYVIERLTITSTSNLGVGLFSAIGSGGTISNLGLTNVAITVRSNSSAGGVGGLAGANFGTITNSYVTGVVVAEGQGIGLLVGYNGYPGYLGFVTPGTINGAILSSFAVGTVSSSGTSAFQRAVGGLAGINLFGSVISNAYASVAILDNGNAAVGGLVGQNNGTILTSYAAGPVSGGGQRGGLVGLLFGNVFNSYWDSEASGQSTSAGGVPLSTAQLQTTLPTGFESSIWGIVAGRTYPYLLWQNAGISGFAYADRGITALVGTTITQLVNGSVIGTATTDAYGFYNISLTPATIYPAGSHTLIYTTGASGGAAYQSNVTGFLVGYNIYGTYLRQTSGADTLSAINAGTSTAIGSNAAAQTLVRSLVNREIISTAPSFTLDQAINTNGALILNASGTINAPNAVNVESFALHGGAWTQVAANVPSFSANDFRILGGSFLRAKGGDGSSSSPYQIADIFGLQGVTAGKNHVLVNNIDASGTANWNSGAGFVPIPPYTDRFDGQNFAIDSLVINSSAANVGLFGVIGRTGNVRNLTLTSLQVTSSFDSQSSRGSTGGLAGTNNGLISNVSVSGSVTNNGPNLLGNATGGLVGTNQGLISDSNADVSIRSTGALTNLGSLGGPLNASVAGGLVGSNNPTGQIIRSYATGSIVGTNLVFGGGLVGANDGTISVAYATGNVTLTAGVDASRVGGFAGRVAGTVDRAYALGNVTADFIGMTGFAGGFAGSNRGLISQSYSMGSVTAGGSQELFVGGFTGLNHNTISKSYSLTPVATVGSAAEKFIGGFAGLNTGTLDQVYATGLVQAPAGSITGGLVVGATTPAGSVAGGLVGSNTMTDFTYSTLGPVLQPQITFRTGVITNSYWDKDSTGQTLSDGGAGLTTVAARQQTSYVGFAFGSVWAPNDLAFNSGYPYLLTVPPQNPSSPPVLPTGTPTPPPLAPPSGQISYGQTYSYTSVTGQTLTVNYNTAAATVGGHTFVPISQFDSSLPGTDSWTAVNAMIARSAGEASFAIAAAPISTTTIGNYFALGFITSGKPVIVGGTIIRDGVPETHWMLATAVTADGKIVANDPWTGGQVIIDPRTGSVVQPPNFPLSSFKMDRFQVVTIR